MFKVSLFNENKSHTEQAINPIVEYHLSKTWQIHIFIFFS